MSTSIHEACFEGDVKALKKIFAESKNPSELINLVDGIYNRTPLMFSCVKGHFEVAKYLVENGGRINDKDKRGFGALHFASMNGYLDIVDLLTENGADVNIKTENNETSLHWAVKRKYPEIAKSLLGSGVNYFLKSDNNEVAEQASLMSSSTSDLFLEFRDGLSTIWVSESIKSKDSIWMFEQMTTIPKDEIPQSLLSLTNVICGNDRVLILSMDKLLHGKSYGYWRNLMLKLKKKTENIERQFIVFDELMRELREYEMVHHLSIIEAFFLLREVKEEVIIPTKMLQLLWGSDSLSSVKKMCKILDHYKFLMYYENVSNRTHYSRGLYLKENPPTDEIRLPTEPELVYEFTLPKYSMFFENVGLKDDSYVIFHSSQVMYLQHKTDDEQEWYNRFTYLRLFPFERKRMMDGDIIETSLRKIFTSEKTVKKYLIERSAKEIQRKTERTEREKEMLLEVESKRPGSSSKGNTPKVGRKRQTNVMHQQALLQKRKVTLNYLEKLALKPQVMNTMFPRVSYDQKFAFVVCNNKYHVTEFHQARKQIFDLCHLLVKLGFRVYSEVNPDQERFLNTMEECTRHRSDVVQMYPQFRTLSLFYYFGYTSIDGREMVFSDGSTYLFSDLCTEIEESDCRETATNLVFMEVWGKQHPFQLEILKRNGGSSSSSSSSNQMLGEYCAQDLLSDGRGCGKVFQPETTNFFFLKAFNLRLERKDFSKDEIGLDAGSNRKRRKRRKKKKKKKNDDDNQEEENEGEFDEDDEEEEEEEEEEGEVIDDDDDDELLRKTMERIQRRTRKKLKKSGGGDGSKEAGMSDGEGNESLINEEDEEGWRSSRFLVEIIKSYFSEVFDYFRQVDSVRGVSRELILKNYRQQMRRKGKVGARKKNAFNLLESSPSTTRMNESASNSSLHGSSAEPSTPTTPTSSSIFSKTVNLDKTINRKTGPLVDKIRKVEKILIRYNLNDLVSFIKKNVGFTSEFHPSIPTLSIWTSSAMDEELYFFAEHPPSSSALSLGTRMGRSSYPSAPTSGLRTSTSQLLLSKVAESRRFFEEGVWVQPEKTDPFDQFTPTMKLKDSFDRYVSFFEERYHQLHGSSHMNGGGVQNSALDGSPSSPRMGSRKMNITSGMSLLSGQKFCVLVRVDDFNPPQIQHLKMFDEAYNYIQDELDCAKVLGGFFIIRHKPSWFYGIRRKDLLNMTIQNHPLVELDPFDLMNKQRKSLEHQRSEGGGQPLLSRFELETNSSVSFRRLKAILRHHQVLKAPKGGQSMMSMLHHLERVLKFHFSGFSERIRIIMLLHPDEFVRLPIRSYARHKYGLAVLRFKDCQTSWADVLKKYASHVRYSSNNVFLVNKNANVNDLSNRPLRRFLSVEDMWDKSMDLDYFVVPQVKDYLSQFFSKVHYLRDSFARMVKDAKKIVAEWTKDGKKLHVVRDQDELDCFKIAVKVFNFIMYRSRNYSRSSSSASAKSSYTSISGLGTSSSVSISDMDKKKNNKENKEKGGKNNKGGDDGDPGGSSSNKKMVKKEMLQALISFDIDKEFLSKKKVLRDTSRVLIDQEKLFLRNSDIRTKVVRVITDFANGCHQFSVYLMEHREGLD